MNTDDHVKMKQSQARNKEREIAGQPFYYSTQPRDLINIMFRVNDKWQHQFNKVTATRWQQWGGPIWR